MNSNKWLKLLTIAENIAIENIDNPEIWIGNEVVYSPPRVERLTITKDDFRIHLHKIYPTDKDNSFFHYHPWECAFKILEGGYDQKIGYGDISLDYPQYIVGDFCMRKGSMYIMDIPESWHQVMPSKDPSYSIMVTKKVWPKNKKNLEILMKKVARKDEKTIEINTTRKIELLNEFKKFFTK